MHVASSSTTQQAQSYIDQHDGSADGIKDGMLQWDEIKDAGIMTEAEFRKYAGDDGNLSLSEMTKFLEEKERELEEDIMYLGAFGWCSGEKPDVCPAKGRRAASGGGLDG